MELCVYFNNYYQKLFEVHGPGKNNLSQQTRDLGKVLRLSQLKKEFSSKREKYDNKLDYLKFKDSQVDKRLSDLQQSSIKYNQFLLKSLNKKEFALKKSNEERNKRVLKEQIMSKLKKEINELEKESIVYQDKINKNEKYQLSMDEVIANSENFYEVKDLIKRYDTLVATHVKLLEKDEKNQEIISAKKAQLAKYKENKENEIQQYNNEI